MNGTVEDGPDVLCNLLEADEVVFEQAGDEDLPALPPEGAASGRRGEARSEPGTREDRAGW